MPHPSAPENVSRDLERMMKVYSYIDSSGGDVQWFEDELDEFETETEEDEELVERITELLADSEDEFDNPTDEHEHLMDVYGDAMETYEDGNEADAILIMRNDAEPIMGRIRDAHEEIVELVKDMSGTENSELLRAAEYVHSQYRFMHEQTNAI